MFIFCQVYKVYGDFDIKLKPIILLLLLPILLFGGNKIVTKTWTKASGLPSNTINTIVQNDYLWIGTDAGLVQFDGIEFRNFTKTNTPEITTDKITALHIDSQDNLWIGTDGGGLVSYNSGKWNNYKLSNNHIKAITGDWNGNIWIGTGYGLYKLKDKKIEKFTVDHGLAGNIITSLEFDSWGNLWIGSLQRGITKYFDNSFVVYDDGNGLENLLITSLHSNKLGNLFIGTTDGVYQMKYNESIITKTPDSDYIPVTCFLEKDKEFWLGTMTEGIKNLKHRDFKSVMDFKEEYITCLFEDVDGNVWVGTESNGITKIQTTEKKNEKISIRSIYWKSGFFIIFVCVIVLGILSFFVFYKKPKTITSKNKERKNEIEIDSEIVNTLDKMIEKDKIFLDPDLTMKSLAQKLFIHNNTLSKIINDHYGMNYNDFINQYRIEEAQDLLVKYKKKTVSEIMYQCGFYSKSTFNTAFKKFSNTTPSQYRKENL